jgi:Cdc6-like AAA superfamily ATPase
MTKKEVLKYLTNQYGLTHKGGMSEMDSEERVSFLLESLEKLGIINYKSDNKQKTISNDEDSDNYCGAA